MGVHHDSWKMKALAKPDEYFDLFNTYSVSEEGHRDKDKQQGEARNFVSRTQSETHGLPKVIQDISLDENIYYVFPTPPQPGKILLWMPIACPDAQTKYHRLEGKGQKLVIGKKPRVSCWSTHVDPW